MTFYPYDKNMAPKKIKKQEQLVQEEYEDTEEYRKRRDRNNLAVKRSRVKSKQKTQETLQRVNQLKSENTVLEERVKELTKQLTFLKELFLAHASNKADGPQFQNINLDKLLSDN